MATLATLRDRPPIVQRQPRRHGARTCRYAAKADADNLMRAVRDQGRSNLAVFPRPGDSRSTRLAAGQSWPVAVAAALGPIDQVVRDLESRAGDDERLTARVEAAMAAARLWIRASVRARCTAAEARIRVAAALGIVGTRPAAAGLFRGTSSRGPRNGSARRRSPEVRPARARRCGSSSASRTSGSKWMGRQARRSRRRLKHRRRRNSAASQRVQPPW
jgi:hypothetical protein